MLLVNCRGKFLSLQGQPKDYGKKTRFVTPMMMATPLQTGPCALRFYYYMFGANVGSLTISVRYANQYIQSTAQPQVINGNQGQQWLRAIYSYSDHRPFQFIIEGQVGNGPQSDIAIDDISFSEGCLPSTQKPIITSTTSHTINPSDNPSVRPTKTIPIQHKSQSNGNKSNCKLNVA